MVLANTHYIVLKAIQQLLIRIRQHQMGYWIIAELQFITNSGNSGPGAGGALYTPELLVT
jgi:hypothetical protein